MNALVDDLQRRGVIAQSTEIEALARDLDQGPMTLYCGFDPTAPSLHLGNLLQILTVARFQRAGHVPLALVGGATGLIGDPKSSGERALNSAEIVEQWSTRVKSQLERFFDFTGPNAAQMVNNYDWTHEVSVLEFLRDIGKHFSVNRMLDREAVAARLADAGISFTCRMPNLSSPISAIALARDLKNDSICGVIKLAFLWLRQKSFKKVSV